MSLLRTLRFPRALAAPSASPMRAFTTTAPRPSARTTIIGRLVAAPEEVSTPNGHELIRYSVASETGPKNNRVVSFFRVASFAQDAQKQYIMGIGKGTLVYVEADTRLRLVEDAEGKRAPKLDLVQRSIEVLSKPRNAGEPGEGETTEI